MKGAWELARITSLNKRTGKVEVFCRKYNCFISASLPELINSQHKVYDTVRIFVEVLPYTLRIKMLTKTRG